MLNEIDKILSIIDIIICIIDLSLIVYLFLYRLKQNKKFVSRLAKPSSKLKFISRIKRN